jgi:exonuclease SbcC
VIIQSVRLKNIKSYGEGPDGNGVFISFETGINRVSGRNGHGKTTLIESIGYALFITEPQFEENFRTETYFLSHGAKEGEIDVTFRYDRQSYRVERAVGKQSKRLAKVVQLSDQSICAEGDAEVSAFLCRLLQIPDPKHLSEIFCKLVGVKQGRLTWPFDSRSTEAKSYFEPLLEVDVFRNCFEHLKAVIGVFDGQKAGLKNRQTAAATRKEQNDGSPQRVAELGQQVKDLGCKIEAANKACAEALQSKKHWEALEKAVDAAEVAEGLTRQSAEHATKLRKIAEREFSDSKIAQVKLSENEAAHQAYTEALQVLSALEKQREQRDTLKEQRDQFVNERDHYLNQSSAARDRSKDFSGQAEEKQKESDALAAEVAKLQEALDASAPRFQKAVAEAETAEAHQRMVDKWIDGLASLDRSQRKIAENVARLAKEVAGWDTSRLKEAKAAAEAADQALKATQAKLDKAEERHTTLEEQLQEISGGVCPFLKEKCRQFDPAKVKASLKKQTSLIAQLQRELVKARTEHDNAESALEDLKRAETLVSGKRLELVDALAHYNEGLQLLQSATVSDSIEWLGAWQAGCSRAPAVPKFPSKKGDAAAVAKCHGQFERFRAAAEAWWLQGDTQLKARLKELQATASNRKNQETTLKLKSEALSKLQEEIASFAKKAAAKEKEAQQHEAKATELVTQLKKVELSLQPFASLDSDLKREQGKRDANQPGYELYLGAKKLADQLSARQEKLTQQQAEETKAQTALKAATETLQKAAREFDPQKLEAAREDHRTKDHQSTELQTSLEAEKKNLTLEEQRFATWLEACKELQFIAAEIARCDAAIELTELARKTLRDTAPAVAQHLCNRIAVRAQSVFNQISPEPIELLWDAESYSLRITPGERRFAMLSGGEQTKLALAMTLAMIEEFSQLRFCIFDEPTYAVDAESRQKLADAILQAQAAAGLEQLLLVSHDDAFEGKIEHSIVLEKNPAAGTRVALI